MPRFRVEVHSTNVYFVDAQSEARAAMDAITLAAADARPAYRMDSTADAEFYSDPEGAKS